MKVFYEVEDGYVCNDKLYSPAQLLKMVFKENGLLRDYVKGMNRGRDVIQQKIEDVETDPELRVGLQDSLKILDNYSGRKKDFSDQMFEPL